MLTISELRLVSRAITRIMPEIEVSVHSGDIDEELLEDLNEAYSIIEDAIEKQV